MNIKPVPDACATLIIHAKPGTHHSPRRGLHWGQPSSPPPKSQTHIWARSSACGCSTRVSLLGGHPYQKRGWASWTGAELCMTSLSLTSGVSLLALWSAIAGTLIGLFCKAFLRRSVLCGLDAAPCSPYADQGFSWSPRPPRQAPGKAVASGDECYFKEMSPFRKITSRCFVSRSDFSQGFCSSAACVGSHASLLSGTTQADAFFGSLYRF